MKKRTSRLCFLHLVFPLLFSLSAAAQPQGKVVINEYMPWTSNSCGVTSEFVELLNFGPGPVNIGCYILTTGIYSITIPPNTILLPGEFYVLAGKNFLPGNCANVDSTATGITADLNWNTCNCTNTTIPSANTSQGFMADNGNSPLVLMDPSLNVIDAVVRSLPGEPTTTITSSSVSGNCTSRTFNIGTMGLPYEQLGMAPGNQNSFARSLDGDCNWLKQPSVSGNATNNRKGNTTDISYDFDMVKATSCEESGTGSVSIYVKHSNYASIFPMSYTISMDMNNDGIFDFNDQYATYEDDSPPFIEIDNLPVGRFKVTVYSVKGCYLKNFDFPIIPCDPNTLPVRLLYFKNTGTSQNQHQLEWLLQDVQNLQSVVVQKAGTDGKYGTEKVITNESFRGDKLFAHKAEATPTDVYYRLKVTQKNGRSFYSPVINTATTVFTQTAHLAPNPAMDRLNVQLNSRLAQKVNFTLYNSGGVAIKSGYWMLNAGENAPVIPLHSLTPGIYQLQVTGLAGEKQPISLRFVKH